MASSQIREAVEAASTYLAQHPDEARYTDSAAVAVIEDGLRVRVTGPGGETLTTDMPTSVGGGADAPSPGWLLRAAEASCVATLLAMRAAMLGIELRDVEVTVDSVSDDRGILGLDDSVPAGPLSGRVAVRVASTDADSATLEEAARWAVQHCPVTDALERSVPITVELEAPASAGSA